MAIVRKLHRKFPELELVEHGVVTNLDLVTLIRYCCLSSNTVISHRICSLKKNILMFIISQILHLKPIINYLTSGDLCESLTFCGQLATCRT